MLVAALPLFLSACLVVAGCGGNEGPSDVESLVAKAQDAGEAIDSYHMVLSMSFEGAEAGRVKTEELVIDIAGDNVSLKDTFYDPETGEGTVIQEVVRVGDKQWSNDFTGGGWVEGQATLNKETAVSYTSHISDFVTNSLSAQILGEEEMNRVNAIRLHFELSPENISSLLTDIPQSNLESNAGGQVDIWVDAASYYPVKYEMVFRKVTLGSGYNDVDVRITIDITDINGPLEIRPPV